MVERQEAEELFCVFFGLVGSDFFLNYRCLLVIVFDCFLESLKRAAEIAAETRDFLRAEKEYYDKQYYE